MVGGEEGCTIAATGNYWHTGGGPMGGDVQIGGRRQRRHGGLCVLSDDIGCNDDGDGWWWWAAAVVGVLPRWWACTDRVCDRSRRVAVVLAMGCVEQWGAGGMVQRARGVAVACVCWGGAWCVY